MTTDTAIDTAADTTTNDNQQTSEISLLDGVDETSTIDFSKGEKPEGFPDDYWDADKKAPKADTMYEALQKQEKIAKDLRAKMGKGDHKAPKEAKEYTFTVDEKYKEMVPENDPIIEEARNVALKYGLSKEAFQGFMTDMIGKVGDLRSEMADAQPSEEDIKAYRDTEYAKIGANATQVIKAVESWGRELQATGQISEEGLKAFKGMATNAEQVKVLNALRSLAGGGNRIPIDYTDDGLESDSVLMEKVHNLFKEGTQAAYSKVDEIMDKRQRAGRPTTFQS